MRRNGRDQLGRRGYLQSDDGNVPDMTEHATRHREDILRPPFQPRNRMTTPRALDEIGAATGRDAFQGPWRITFDTNPDDCNLHCIMCEDHSPYSSTQEATAAPRGCPGAAWDIDLIRRVISEAAGSGPARNHTVHHGRTAALPLHGTRSSTCAPHTA